MPYTLTVSKIHKVLNTTTPAINQQNANVLISDPIFMNEFMNNIGSTILSVNTEDNKIFVERYRDEMYESLAISDFVNLRKTLLRMFNSRKQYVPEEGKGVDFKVVIGKEPTSDDVENKEIVLGSAYTNLKFIIQSQTILALSPQTRALLGIDQIGFFDEQSGLLNAVFQTPANKEAKELDKAEKSSVSTYTGVDIVTSISMGKVITNINDIKTISISTHRDVVQGRSCGSAYASGVSRGGRTIAGSIICTVRLKDPLTGLDPQHLLGYSDLTIENDKDLFKEQLLPDQYPLFDLMMVYQNEYGDSSARMIYGITLGDSGETISINDNELEIQYTYTALDMDPIRKMRFDADGVVINPFQTNEYMKRKERIIQGNSLHNDPFTTPDVVTKAGNISHLDFLM